MKAHAANLSDLDIDKIADYFSSFKDLFISFKIDSLGLKFLNLYNICSQIIFEPCSKIQKYLVSKVKSPKVEYLTVLLILRNLFSIFIFLFTNLNKISKSINQGLDIFDRDMIYQKIDFDNSFPNYIQNNRKKFKDWIL